MPSWPVAQEKLDRLIRKTDTRRPRKKSIPKRLEKLAQAQLEKPLTTTADCATALELGLYSMGVDMAHPCPGRELIRAALAHLRSS